MTSAATTALAKQIAEHPATEHVTERFENVFDIVELMGGAVYAGVTVLVITRPLVLIAQDLVGLGGLFEFFDGVFVIPIAVGMVLDRQLTIRAIDLLLRRRPFDAKDFVIAGL